nr:hypothetical protein HK105_007463 [Polyrhizophydium stewartii]
MFPPHLPPQVRRRGGRTDLDQRDGDHERKFPGCLKWSTVQAAIRAKSHNSTNSISRLPVVDQWDYGRIKQAALEFSDGGVLERINHRFFGHLPLRLRPQ